MAAGKAAWVMPASELARIMDLLSVAPARRMSRPVVARSAGACAAICLTVTLPMRPVPTKPTWRGTCGARGGGTRWGCASGDGVEVGIHLVSSPSASDRAGWRAEAHLVHLGDGVGDGATGLDGNGTTRDSEITTTQGTGAGGGEVDGGAGERHRE